MGITHIARSRVLRELSIGVAAALLVIGFEDTLIFALAAALHRSPAFIGVMSSFQGAGAVVGGLTAPRIMQRVGEVRLAGIGLLAFGLGDVCWLVTRVDVVLASITVAGLGIVWAIVALSTAYQRRSPSHLQGRVAGAANMIFSVPQALSIAAGAALIAVVPYRIEVVAIFVVLVVTSAYLLTRRRDVADEAEVEPALAA
jgi:hypothetical protein